MQKLTNADPETKSPDFVAENIARLRALFPEMLTEGKEGVAVNLDVLKQLVGDKTVTDTEEKYGLNWHGKRLARQIALTPSTGTLRPCPEESVDWDTTRNLMIEGDNLEVLKLLQKSYAGKVKLIYIDPPYNTGKDFVYPDNFQDNIRNYLELTGQVGEGGQKLTSNTESSGRFHTDWLNMMYPRLKLARNLLKEDGAVFVSIADDEIHNLRTLLNDVFGEENFVATCVWQKRYSRENRGIIGDVHDYIVCFARNLDAFARTRHLLRLTDESAAVYKNPNKDPRGRWRGIPMTAQGTRPNQMYEIITPAGARHKPPSGRCWSTVEPEFLKLKAEGRIWFGADGRGQPNVIRYLSEVEGLVPWTWWPHEEVGHTDESKKEVNQLFDGHQVFDTPKPVRLLNRILEISTGPEDNEIILDFFAGSGTTGHSSLLQNLKDSGNRRYILVQLPEPLNVDDKDQRAAATFCDSKQRPRNIAELTKERLRRSGLAVRQSWSDAQAARSQQLDLTDSGSSAPSQQSPDLGFRVFKLASSNIRAWEPNRDKLAETLEASIEHLKTDRTEQDILFELLLKLGLDLTVPIEQKVIAGKTVHSIGVGTLIVCLAPAITAEEVESLALGIVDWHKAEAPAGESTLVFRDSGFADDVAKTNLAAILQQHGLQTVRSI
jgi:adenine-specific DNA-methyltransferase